ncbi:2-oxoacid:acceptor oxidoreductase family protein [Sulfodiicoccus acidiphilus]|uniref:2-oxoacid:acceptor oxidoreductase family protein n=1 Tax=Sulfodiicoccus acidiphilus TaxID=1670455 RepID=UPI0016661792|nr:2-oxoacid:acceptor oxidoreductase family protein [Sulfodiicoccus acidiphilus]
MLEVRFHGRGGQGVVTMANLLGEAAAYDGLFSSAFPIYGAERRGAEIEAYCRISPSPIRVTSPITEPDVVVVIDPTIISVGNPFSGLKDSGMIVLNSPRPVELRWRTFVVDATSVASEHGLVRSGWPMVNVVMLGALVKAVGAVTLDSLERAVMEEFSGKVAEQNIKAMRVAYERTREVMKVAA